MAENDTRKMTSNHKTIMAASVNKWSHSANYPCFARYDPSLALVSLSLSIFFAIFPVYLYSSFTFLLPSDFFIIFVFSVYYVSKK